MLYTTYLDGLSAEYTTSGVAHGWHQSTGLVGHPSPGVHHPYNVEYRHHHRSQLYLPHIPTLHGDVSKNTKVSLEVISTLSYFAYFSNHLIH